MGKTNPFAELSTTAMRKRLKKPFPQFIPPMLATLTDDYFADSNWVYEHKFDGERCIAFKRNGVVTLKSRNRNVINTEYPELVQALTDQAADNFVIDGEIIATDKHGLSDFQLLQGRMNLKNIRSTKSNRSKVPISYRIFDIMYLDQYDLRQLGLIDRKHILKKMLHFNQALVYSNELTGDGIKLFNKACHLKWEGLIVKAAHSAYVGKRSKDWLKFKCIMQEELIIVGYTEPQGQRTDFGALLVGYYQKQKLIFAGKVGTGYSQATLKLLGAKLRKLEIKKCPIAEYNESTNGVHWVRPELVAEFKFAEWTKAGRLRAPRYKGLRDDKVAQEVVREG